MADDRLVEVNALIETTIRAGKDPKRQPLPAHLGRPAFWPF